MSASAIPRLIYVCGAFSAATVWDQARNVLAAQAAALDVARAGGWPLVPHAVGALLVGRVSESFALAATLELVRRADAVYCFNPRHLETSDGTRGEVAEAERLELPVFYDLTELAAWIVERVAA